MMNFNSFKPQKMELFSSDLYFNNNIESNIIERFKIYGLFNNIDVDIDFKDNVKILIGENGLGKTQILSIFYYTLARKFEKLTEYFFEKIEIKFYNEESMIIHKSEIDYIVSENLRSPLKEVYELIGYEQFNQIRNTIANGRMTRMRFIKMPFLTKLRQFGSEDYIYYSFKQLAVSTSGNSSNLFSANVLECKDRIATKLKDYQILYFPTYRRVEEDLYMLGHDEEALDLNKEDNKLIHFGMDDVDTRFKNITRRINRLSQEGFAKISSEILSQLVKGVPEVNEAMLENVDINNIKIILSRVGSQISPDNKKRIVSMFSGDKIELRSENIFLVYFLQKLIEIYDQQRSIDQAIKIFVQVCKNYLVEKEVVYDESAVEIYIKSFYQDRKLLLSKLSSGEKQIISILSKIYLSQHSNYIVLFDEPELSLSIFWQRTLLPDIMKSGKCSFMLAVTHSPFIFENELDKYAVGIRDFFTIK